MKQKMLRLPAGLIVTLTLALIALAGPAFAAGPELWQKGFQPPASPVMERIEDFHMILLYVITAITVFVLMLMLFIVLRFNAKANPEPSKTTHNTLLEVIWTVIPVVILVLIAVPSLKLLYYGDRTADPEMTIKVTGYQWYWGFEYPDYEGLNYMVYMVPQDEIDEAKGQKRLLSTDKQLVLPTDTNIQILVTAADVLHSFTVPPLGFKVDAVPGRINETWTRIEKPGTYYGQCSELCGKDHAFMPVEVRAVPKEEFDAWIEIAKKEYVSYEDYKAQQKTKLASATNTAEGRE